MIIGQYPLVSSYFFRSVNMHFSPLNTSLLSSYMAGHGFLGEISVVLTPEDFLARRRVPV